MSTPSTSSPSSSPVPIRSQINRKLLESGEYDRYSTPHFKADSSLSKSAKRKFDEAGWTDEIKAAANSP